MKNWFNKKLIIGSILIGLIVGISVNFHHLSYPPVSYSEESQVKSILTPTIVGQSKSLHDDSYWRGMIDQKLISIEEKIKELSSRFETLNVNLINLRLDAAKQGGIYGGLSSVVILLSSILVRELRKGRKKNEKNIE